MSEAPDVNTDTSGVDKSPATPGTPAASLYPDGGGTVGAADAPVVPAGESGTASAGTDTLAGTSGADSVSGTDTSTGTDTASGADTLTGTDTQSGTDKLTVDSYKDLTLPEGFVADDALMTTAKITFAELGIAPDKAPALVKLFADATTAANAKATETYQAQQTAWLAEINALPEFQGEARATSLQAIGRMFDEYGSNEAKAALDAYGVGNNPALAKMFLKMASALSEGVPTGQGRPTPTGADGKPASMRGKTMGQRLYPDQPQT